MTLPNMIIVGAPKSGTTTLHYALDQHPEIFMSRIKEPGFFWAYGDEVELKGPSAILLRHRVINDLGQYMQLFRDVNDEHVVGESSASYMFQPRSPGLISQFIPNSKLIFILRQPAERAFSSYTQYLRDGVEPCSSFWEAVLEEQQGQRDHWTFGRHLKYGFYCAALQQYLNCFKREQIFISLYDDLKQNPLKLFKSIFQFLEVEENFQPDLSHHHNVSGVISKPLMRFFWTNTNKLRAFIRPLINQRLRHAFSEWVFRSTEKPEFPEKLKYELTEFYREDVEQLQDYIHRDLSHWLKPVN